VLLAEDDDDARAVFADSLRRAGYAVIEVANGAQLLDALTGAPAVDLVISDVRMPIVSGLDALVAMRAARFKTPFIVITAFGSAEAHREAKLLGARAVLDKPFQVRVLLAVVRAALVSAA
jgi:CheY-like chemotaxis protein